MSTDAMRPLGATADRSTARLGSSLHVKGEISGNEDLLIDGTVEGLIQLDERKLTVGATAKVTADIIAREVVVYGSVKGNLRAKDRIEIKKDGSVNGDLTTARIMIEDARRKSPAQTRWPGALRRPPQPPRPSRFLQYQAILLKRSGPPERFCFWCAEHVRQLGGASPLHNQMEVK
jgi:cytoskeletal protein CcmA (bactofilin family)